MRFLVDECTGPAVARWLREQSHEVFSVYEEARGMADDDILDKAYLEDWILITNDKDFGEKVYRERHPHHGVILLRLQDERAAAKIEAIEKLVDGYEEQLADAFVVATEASMPPGCRRSCGAGDPFHGNDRLLRKARTASCRPRVRPNMPPKMSITKLVIMAGAKGSGVFSSATREWRDCGG
jgi:predicted nuclease of predicted toxin-antitoxin system